MKIAIISDIHQTDYWRKVIDQKDDFDKIIFLGDEFDSWDNRWPFQMENAQDIITFKKNCTDKVDLCWSNHAISYYLEERCSGYQSGHAAVIKDFYKTNEDLFNPVYVYDDWIFSHAGVSVQWMKRCGISELSEINQLFKSRPSFFRWIGPNDFGNNSNEGPLWIRPEALTNNYVMNYNQVAGHTEYEEPNIIRKNNLTFVFSDTHDHNYLTIIDTSANTARFENLQ